MSQRSKFEIIVDAGVALLRDKLFLLVVVVFGGTAIWGREYVAQMFDIIGELISKAKQ